MAGPLGWSRKQTASEVEHYRTRVEAERNSQLEDDDESANRERLRASDIVPTIALAYPPRSESGGESS
jgi:glycerol-3-phosphate dehydrogenase